MRALVAATTAALVSVVAHAQDTTVSSPCDPKLIRPAKDPLGYERRGERCEGVYIQEVSGSAGLLVVSFTQASEPFELVPREPLRIAWSGTLQSPVRLRAVALRRRLYYRMDTERPPGVGAFEWPTDILVSLQLRTEEIGLVGWMDQRVGGQPQDVYVPLRVGPRSAARSGRYVVTIVPGTELSEVYVTLASVDADGREVKKLKDGEALKYGYYPAERTIRMPLPTLERAGLYRLELGASLSRGGSVTRSLFFFHPGE